MYKIYNNLARYVKEERMSRGWNRAELSRRMGYQNVSKGMNRVLNLEREGTVPLEVLEKMISALGLDEEKVEDLLEQDREAYEAAYEAWLDKPVEMHLTIRLIPAVFGHKSLPEHVTSEEEALAYACEQAKSRHKKVWLVVSRRKIIYIDEEGTSRGTGRATPYYDPGPWMSLKGKRDRFLFKEKDG